MQMDLNCADIEHLVIADAHGFIDIQTLNLIFPFRLLEFSFLIF